MSQNNFVAEVVLIFLISIICFILVAGLYFVCRAIFYKARHVPRRHLKYWVPNVLSGSRPSPSSELILAEPLGIPQGAHFLGEDEITGEPISVQDPEQLNFQDRVSASIDLDGKWDEVEIGQLSTFSTHSGTTQITNSANIVVLQDYSMPPTIIPIVHNFV